jgi:hypothetical protein
VYAKSLVTVAVATDAASVAATATDKTICFILIPQELFQVT